MGETRGTKTPEVGGRSVLVLTHLRVTLMTVQTHPPGWPCRDPAGAHQEPQRSGPGEVMQGEQRMLLVAVKDQGSEVPTPLWDLGPAQDDCHSRRSRPHHMERGPRTQTLRKSTLNLP